MSLHNRIKEARKNKGITQTELGDKIGVAKTTVAGYEKNREPTAAQLGAIADILDVDVEFLLQDEIRIRHETRATPQEMETLVKKYRTLDPYGKEAVDGVLDVEYRRCRQNQAARDAALFRGGREETEAAEIFPELKMPTLVSKSGLEAEKKQLMEALDKFSPVQLQMYFDQMRKLSGLQIEASPSFVPPEDAQKVLGPDSSAPPL